MFGGDDRPYAREPGGEPAVEAGAVEVGVDEVVAAVADQLHEPGQDRQVAVAGHAEVGDADAVGEEAVGDGPGLVSVTTSQRTGKMPQQQPQLLLGAADAEPGDDVRDLHRLPPPAPSVVSASLFAVPVRRACPVRRA